MPSVLSRVSSHHSKPSHSLLLRALSLPHSLPTVALKVPRSSIMSVVGKYEMLTSENFDEYLKAAGVNIAKRALAAAAKPKILITEADGTYTLKTMSAFKDTTITFKLGEEFDEETADGRSSKTIITLDGSKLVQIQRIAPDEATTTREFNEGGMTATFTTKGVTAVRTYKRV